MTNNHASNDTLVSVVNMLNKLPPGVCWRGGGGGGGGGATGFSCGIFTGTMSQSKGLGQINTYSELINTISTPLGAPARMFPQ